MQGTGKGKLTMVVSVFAGNLRCRGGMCSRQRLAGALVGTQVTFDSSFVLLGIVCPRGTLYLRCNLAGVFLWQSLSMIHWLDSCLGILARYSEP